MPSLRSELKSITRMNDLDNSIREVQHSFREKTPLSYESKLQNLYNRGIISEKKLTSTSRRVDVVLQSTQKII